MISKAWLALNSMNIIWKSNLNTHLKRNLLKLVYGSVTWTLITSLEKRTYETYTRILRAVTNKSWKIYTHVKAEDRWSQLKKQI